MSDPFDEFEEFRARSYSGGLSLRPTDPGVHKSMVELCLSSDKTGLKAISKKCYGSAYFNGPSPTTESTSPTHYGHSLHPNVNCQVETTTRRASHHNIKSTNASYGTSGCNNNFDKSDPAPVSTSIMKKHPSLDEIPHRRRSYGHSYSYSSQKSDPSPSPGLYRPRSSSSCVPCNKPDGMRSHGSNRALSHNTCLHQENTSICQKHGHDVHVMRPRVNTMPSVPNICINQYQYDVTPDLLLVRKFTIKRGKVTEGESVVRQSSVVSVVSTGSGGSSRSLSSSVDHELSRVLIHGNTGVGKCTLIGAFSKVNDSSVALDDEGEKMVSVLLDGEESALEFVDVTDDQSNEFLTNDQVDAYVIVYSVEDRKSFEGAIDRLYELRNEEDDRSKAVILVANKSDLVRTRVILEEEGKSAAKTYDCKYIEVSAAIDHKVDELLVGIVKQIRLLRSKREALERHRRKATFGHHCCPIRPQQNMLGKLLGTRLFSSKSCENLYVL